MDLVLGIAVALLILWAMDRFVRTLNRADRRIAEVLRRSR